MPDTFRLLCLGLIVYKTGGFFLLLFFSFLFFLFLFWMGEEGEKGVLVALS